MPKHDVMMLAVPRSLFFTQPCSGSDVALWSIAGKELGGTFGRWSWESHAGGWWHGGSRGSWGGVNEGETELTKLLQRSSVL